MKKYIGILLLLILGVASYGISKAIVAGPSPAEPAPVGQSGAEPGDAQRDDGPRIEKSGETVTSSSAAEIQRLIAEHQRQAPAQPNAPRSVLESEAGIKLRGVVPTGGGVHFLGDATIFDREISGPYVWGVSVTTTDEETVAEWSYPEGAFLTEAGHGSRHTINEYLPVDLRKGSYFLNLRLDCLSAPPEVGTLGPVSFRFEIH